MTPSWMFSSVTEFLQETVGQNTNNHFCIVTTERNDLLGEFKEGYQVDHTSGKVTDKQGNVFHIVSDVTDIKKGWLHGGQPNAVFFIESELTDWNDKMYVMSRVRRRTTTYPVYMVSKVQDGLSVSFLDGGLVAKGENKC